MSERPQVMVRPEHHMQDEYPAHAIEPRAPMPPAQSMHSPVMFDGITTSALDYVPHVIEPRAVRLTNIAC